LTSKFELIDQESIFIC